MRNSLEETGNQFASRYAQPSGTAAQTVVSKVGKYFWKEVGNSAPEVTGELRMKM